jgi:hypothetical protein
MQDNEQETSKDQPSPPPVGNLTDFVEGCDESNPLYIEVAVNEDGRIIVFHDKPFKHKVSWFEYDLDTSELDFVMDSGEVRNAGMKLVPLLAKNMQNSHQILMVLMDDKTGEARGGEYIPVIIHRA